MLSGPKPIDPLEWRFYFRRMWDKAQTLYIEEVLGLSTESLGRGQAARNARATQTESLPTGAEVILTPTLVEAVVLSPPLGTSERKLLSKILASINISDLQVHVVLPENISVTHVLAFNGSSGVNQNGKSTHWGFPLLAQMCGSGPDVGAHKRETWTQLQKFRDAFNASAR